MTEQIKAWAVVNQYDKVGGLWFDKERAQQDVNLDANAFHLVELTSTPKIKMTQAEWDEFNHFHDFVDDIYSENTPFTALDDLYDDFDSDYPNLRGWVFLVSKITSSKHQREFTQLWASDNPEELVEIK